MKNLQTLFNPTSVALIGATNDEKKVGYALMKNLIESHTREVYPVTLTEPHVLGRISYQSVSAIPGPVSLAIIAVRADVVPSILEECGQKGIKTVIVISAGFKEIGGEGKELESHLTQIAHSYEITLLGPNCLGIMNAHANWNASFSVDSPRKGGTAFVSQSGALGTALLDWANREGVGFSKFVSLGNEAQLTELDFLEYLADDEETKAVLLYVEKVTDGARFLELARRVTQKKPLVVLRAGRSEHGSVAVASHTGSLAPSDAVFGSALSQVGAIGVDSLRTLFSLTKLFELGHTKPLTRLAILTNGGGPSVNTADLIDFSKSLSLVNFTEETKNSLKSTLPQMAAVGNPIDVIGDSGQERYSDALDILVQLPEVDAILTLVTPQMMTPVKEIASVFLEKRHKKPIIPIFMGGNTAREGVEALIEQGMVSFDSPTDVVEALDALACGAKKHTSKVSAKKETSSFSMVPFDTMVTTLKNYNLHLEGVLVEATEDIEGALDELGTGPFAIKAISPTLVHKSDLNAVRLSLATAEEIRQAWAEILERIKEHTGEDAHVEGVLIQRMTLGVECIVGMKRDNVFGPVIVFGLGGIFVEIMKDSSMRIAPISEEEALQQIEEIQGLPLLTGARGQTPVDRQALVRTITSLSKLAIENTHIEEIDFNPVFATPDGVRIVDARFMVK